MTIPDPSVASDHNHERMQRLAAFASDFRNPATSFGIWCGMTGAGNLLEPVTMPAALAARKVMRASAAKLR